MFNYISICQYTSLSSAEVSASLADVLAFYKKESLQIVSDKIVSALAEGCTVLIWEKPDMTAILAMAY